MTKAAAPKKDDATARQTVGQILKQTARVVAYLVALALATAALASCQEWHRAHAINCNAPGVICDF